MNKNFHSTSVFNIRTFPTHTRTHTPTVLEVFFLSCTPSGEAGTSPLEVLSSSRRAPSHSSRWSLSTLRAWPRFVYDTAGGTEGPTEGDILMLTLSFHGSWISEGVYMEQSQSKPWFKWQTILHKCDTEIQKPSYTDKLLPSSCFEMLFLREVQEGSRPADGAKHNSSKWHRRMLPNFLFNDEDEPLTVVVTKTPTKKGVVVWWTLF